MIIMIKFSGELERKQVRMDSWLLKLLSRDMKTRTNKDQPRNNH